MFNLILIQITTITSYFLHLVKLHLSFLLPIEKFNKCIHMNNECMYIYILL